MFTKSKPKQITILDNDITIEFEDEYQLEVILSPSLYWVKKFTVPVKTLKEAMELLPSLFEEFLPEGKYNYYGYFQEEEFIGFAYNQILIINILKDKGIALENVNGIRFAQAEFSHQNLPWKLDEKRVLVLQDDIVIVMPSAFVNEIQEFDLQQLPLSPYIDKLEYNIKINIDKKTFFIFSLLLVVLISIDSIAFLRTSQKSTQLQVEKERLFTQANLPSTMMQNRSLLKRYEKIYNQQYALREFFYRLFHTTYPKDVVLSQLIYNNGKITLKFLHVKNKEEILEKFKGLNITYKVLKENQLVVEISV